MNRYSNNFSDSSQNDYSGGTWVYINGELYHAGVKGMHWYQHMPGTDWWKVGKSIYNTSQKMDPKGSKIKTAVRTASTLARTAAGQYGEYLKGEASYYGNKLRNSKVGKAVRGGAYLARTAGRVVSDKIRNTGAYQSASKFASQVSGQLSEFARNAWQEARSKTQAVFKSFKGQERIDRNTSVATFLDAFQSSQYGDALRNYTDGKSKGSVGNTINQFIQNAQYGIVKGINNYLKKMKLDDDVDRFLSKISGGKSRIYANNYARGNAEERQRRVQQNRVR